MRQHDTGPAGETNDARGKVGVQTGRRRQAGLGRATTAVVAAVLLLCAGSAAAVADAPPDACESAYAAPMDSVAKLKQYEDCRFDRIEQKLDQLAATTPSASSTGTASTAFTPSPTPTATTSAALTTSSAFVARSGTNFVKNGQVVKFHGFNAYGMTGCYSGSAWTTAQLEAYFSSLPANGVTRLWAFRSYGTARIQTILTAAAKYNQHVILTLADGISTCGETDYAVSGDHSGKTLAYYQSGWKNEWSTWARTIVPMFRDNPSILMWETINEPGQKGAVPDLATYRTYLQGTTDLVRSLDPNHLIGVGANTPANFGGASNYTSLMGLPNISAVSFHDYAYQYENKAVVSANYNAAKSAATTHNKPFYGGEAGQLAGASGCTVTLSARATYMKSKADQYFAGGIDALAYWQYAPSRASWVSACPHEIYPGDPTIAMVKSHPAR